MADDPRPTVAPGHLDLVGDEWHLRCATCDDSLRSSPGATRAQVVALVRDWGCGRDDGLWRCGACRDVR